MSHNVSILKAIEIVKRRKSVDSIFHGLGLTTRAKLIGLWLMQLPDTEGVDGVHGHFKDDLDELKKALEPKEGQRHEPEKAQDAQDTRAGEAQAGHHHGAAPLHRGKEGCRCSRDELWNLGEKHDQESSEER